MFLERHFKNTIKQAQSISETARIKSGSLILPRIRQIGLGPTPKTCQWIEGAPTRREIRIHGSDAFKCGDPVHETSVYCDHHHHRAYLPKPLTDKPST